MGRPTTTDRDTARGLVAGSFTGTGNSPDLLVEGGINIDIRGTFVATVKVRRSFDGGTTWAYLSDQDGYADRTYTGPASFWIWEHETGVLYDLECSAFTSGTVTYRLSF